jgi:hypothetical protein
MTMAQTHNLAVQCHQWKLWEGLAILVDYIHHWTPIGTPLLANLPASTLTSENWPFVCSVPFSLYNHSSDHEFSSTMPPMVALGRICITCSLYSPMDTPASPLLGNLPASTLTSENWPFVCSVPFSLYNHSSDHEFSSTMPQILTLGRICITCSLYSPMDTPASPPPGKSTCLHFDK